MEKVMMGLSDLKMVRQVGIKSGAARRCDQNDGTKMSNPALDLTRKPLKQPEGLCFAQKISRFTAKPRWHRTCSTSLSRF